MATRARSDSEELLSHSWCHRLSFPFLPLLEFFSYWVQKVRVPICLPKEDLIKGKGTSGWEVLWNWDGAAPSEHQTGAPGGQLQPASPNKHAFVDTSRHFTPDWCPGVTFRFRSVKLSKWLLIPLASHRWGRWGLESFDTSFKITQLRALPP